MRTLPVGSAIVALALLAAVPAPAASHELVNAGELETLFVSDELSDVLTALPNACYDLGEFYIGEAYVPGIGDGLYIHTILFATADSPLGTGPFEVRFTIRLEGMIGGEHIASLRTADGVNFETDFDDYLISWTPEQVEVQRAFLSYERLQVILGAAGDNFVPPRVTGLDVECFVDGLAADVAPGGYHLVVPGVASLPEIDEPNNPSSQVTGDVPLVGPTRYFKVEALNFTHAGNDLGASFRVTNLLKSGGQHIYIETPVVPTNFNITGHGGEVKPGETRILAFTATIPEGFNPVAMNIVSDIGGRIPFILENTPDHYGLYYGKDGSIIQSKSDDGAAVPSLAGPMAVLGLVAVAVVIRRRG